MTYYPGQPVQKDIEDAQESDPGGSICGYCGNPNDKADDIGWWYPFAWRDSDIPKILPNHPAICNECWDRLGFIHCGER